MTDSALLRRGDTTSRIRALPILRGHRVAVTFTDDGAVSCVLVDDGAVSCVLVDDRAASLAVLAAVRDLHGVRLQRQRRWVGVEGGECLVVVEVGSR